MCYHDETTAIVIALITIFIMLATIPLCIIGYWKTYMKAGKGGWEAIVPFYNIVVLLQITKKPSWWLVFFILSAVPFVNFFAVIPALVFSFIIHIKLAEQFGKTAGYGVGMTLLPFVFVFMLGQSDAKFQDDTVTQIEE